MQNRSFNHEEINVFYKENKKALSEASFDYFQLLFNELNDLIHSFRVNLEVSEKSGKKADNNHLSLRNFSNDVLENLTASKLFLSNYQSEQLSASYHQQLQKITKTQRLFITKKEIFDGYDLHLSDGVLLYIKKLRANLALFVKTKQRKLGNVFRKILKKERIDVRSFRLRKLPFRSMIGYYLGPEYYYQLSQILSEFLKVKGEILTQIWEYDDAFTGKLQRNTEDDTNQSSIERVNAEEFENFLLEAENKIERLKVQLQKQIDEALINAFLRIDQDLAIVDTPDLSSRKFSKKNLLQEQSKLKLLADSSIEKWKNTHLALLDDWSLDVEIMLLYFNVHNEHLLLNNQISNYINDNLSFGLGKLRDYINQSSQRVDGAKTAADLRKLLQSERHKNSQEFIDKMLTKTINKLSGKINDHLISFKQKTLSLVDQVSDKRAFIKGEKYHKESRYSELSWLSPKDLLGFEALPYFIQAISDVETFVFSHLEKTRVKLIALGTVSDFSLESAQMMLDEKRGAVKGAQKVVFEGYQRALNHLEEAEKLLDKIKEEPLSNLQSAIDDFNTDIQKLTHSENILELQMKIVKIRAVEKSKKMRRETWAWIVYFIPKSWEYLNEKVKSGSTVITNIKKKIGIITEKPHISHELSDFLRKTEQSLKKLPFVYQRLYQLTPTDEERFFVGRETELEGLKTAFATWQNNRFITTAIVGEKGSGISSLVLFFLKSIENELPVIHLELKSKIYRPNDYLSFFASAFGQKSFSSNEEIIEFVNQQTTKSIIIIENLQHLYLKVVKGFVCQKMLFDLMTSTWHQLFWIGAYTTHSWEYLNKSIQISSVFTKEIKLDKFTDETLAEVIFKRNYLSGYQVDFQASELGQNSKAYSKMGEKEQQQYLEKNFFKELNQMSNGNVSLAQLYWLRSTHGIEEGIIKIQSLRDFDVSFDKDLPSNYLFALQAMLVHDGLVISDYAKVFNYPEYVCRNDLIPMLEKGLLIKPKDKYNINPIIFRQVVSLLHSHNFIN